jgi:Holliday junction resolvase RusA-like endonuclease
MIAIMIPGTPIAKKRPRFFRRKNFVGAYNPQETEEGKFLLLAKEQFNRAPLEGPLRLSCGFYMPIPKSTSKKKRLAMMNDEIRPDKKPDMSNLLKFVEDCLNEVVWRDDSQIVSFGKMDKFYSEEPRTYVQVEELTNRVQIR